MLSNVFGRLKDSVLSRNWTPVTESEDQYAIQFWRLRPSAVLPTKGTEHATGYDLYAAITEPMEIKAGTTAVVPLGYNISFSPELDVQIRSRSGLASKGIVVANSPATIDVDYCQKGEDFEMKVLLANRNKTGSFILEPGMRCAQLVFCPKPWLDTTLEFVHESEFWEFEGGDREGGCGSTGLK
jgi:dUTP pyrophosphatase